MIRFIQRIAASSVVIFVSLFLLVGVVAAEEVTIPISYSASEAITAADMNFIIYNGSVKSITCGDEFSGFQELIKRDSGCVVFHNSGGTKTGTVASIIVETVDEDLLSIEIDGRLSTLQGTEPSKISLNAGTYTHSEPTPTSIINKDAGPTLTMNQQFIFGGMVVLAVILVSLIGYYVFVYRKSSPTSY